MIVMPWFYFPNVIDMEEELSLIHIFDNETIYEIADKYAAEARTRGDKDSANKVRLDTKMVAAGQTCTFEIPSCSGTSQIGCEMCIRDSNRRIEHNTFRKQ